MSAYVKKLSSQLVTSSSNVVVLSSNDVFPKSNVAVLISVCSGIGSLSVSGPKLVSTRIDSASLSLRNSTDVSIAEILSLNIA